MDGRLSALRRGLALVCAALLGGAASATELEYSGEVYRYGTYKGGGEDEVTLESAAWFFECDAAPSSFPGKSAHYVAVPVVLKSGSVTPENVAISLEGVARPGGIDPEGTFAPADGEPYHVIVWRNEHGRDGRLGADATGRARAALDAVKAAGRFALADVDPAWGTVAVTVDAKGNVKASGTTADGVKVRASGGFLALDDADPYVCASLVFHDRKKGLVYDCSPSWQPLFDADGNLAGSAEDWLVPIHCDPYPFE